MPDRERVSALTVTAVMGIALDAVIAVDREGAIVAWNALATTTFGWAESEVVGRNLGDLIVPSRYRAAHRAGMARFQETGLARVVGQRIEISAIDRNSREFPVELSIVQAPPGGQAAFIGSFATSQIASQPSHAWFLARRPCASRLKQLRSEPGILTWAPMN